MILFWIGCGIVGSLIANSKGNSGCAGMIIGFLLGPIGLLIALFTPKNEEHLRLKEGNTNKCPHCKEYIKPDATICRYCHQSVGFEGAQKTWQVHLPNSSKPDGSKKIIKAESIVILLIVIGLIYMFLPTKTKYESDGDEDYSTQSAAGTSDYYSTWIESTETSQFVEIVQALTQNNVTLCGSFYTKQNKKYRDEYLIACTPNGNIWYYYQVWTTSKKVLGPFSDFTDDPQTPPF